MNRMFVAFVAAVTTLVLVGGFLRVVRPRPAEVGTGRHFAADGNFDAGGRFAPFALGFNLADVGSLGDAKALPAGAQALVWIGSCAGADTAFKAKVAAFAGDPKIFGFYLMDDPDPTGHWHTLCRPENLKAEADWIHANAPGTVAFVALMNMATADKPSFLDTYTPENTHVDLFGIAAYPCRKGTATCDIDMIDRFVAAAHEAGIPNARMVPIYQTFGAGDWRVDGAGEYVLPSPAEAADILARWADVLPAPAFDYAYSWGSQRGDLSLATATSLHEVFRQHNRATVPPADDGHKGEGTREADRAVSG